MSRFDRLKTECVEHLTKAQAIADDRHATDADVDRAQEHLKAGQLLRDELRREKADQNTRAAIRALGESLGGMPGNYNGSGGPMSTGDRKLKAVGGAGNWGATLVRQHTATHGGMKSLTPSGQVNVSVPLNPEPVRIGEPVLALRQLIPTEVDRTGRYSYMRQTTRTGTAAPVAPGALKPTSVYTVTRVDDRTRTIAHLSEAIPRQDLADAMMLADFVDTEMRLGLETALETQIIAGDGTGENFTGLANVSGVQVQAADGTNPLSTTRKAVTKLEMISLAPSGWVLHPTDWEKIELLLDNEGVYYLGNQLPVDRAARRLWGVPVAVSTAATVGTAYLADFTGSTRLYIREDAVIDWSETMYDPNALGAGVGASDFARNMIRMRCEGRFGFAVTRPAGIVKITLPA